MRAACGQLKMVTLKLGGKNPLILFPDVAPDAAADAAVGAMNFNRAGQSCSSTSRVFVHRRLHDAFVAALLQRIAALRLGPPEAEESQVGCLISREQYQKVLSYVEAGRREGARLLWGGGPPEDAALRGGFFVSPTVFDDVRPPMRMGEEEIFGPLLSLPTAAE